MQSGCMLHADVMVHDNPSDSIGKRHSHDLIIVYGHSLPLYAFPLLISTILKVFHTSSPQTYFDIEDLSRVCKSELQKSESVIMTAATRKRELLSKTRVQRRKSSLYTILITLERLKRSVYIVARPITKAGWFGWSSEGKLPLCHWALLISPYNENELLYRLVLQTAYRGSISWGTLFELLNDNGNNKVNEVKHFGRHYSAEWGYAYIMHLGETRSPDFKIKQDGKFPQNSAKLI